MIGKILNRKKVEKTVTTYESTLTEEFAKKIAVSLLNGDTKVMAWTQDIGGCSNSIEIDLLLPEGIELTIKKESYRLDM